MKTRLAHFGRDRRRHAQFEKEESRLFDLTGDRNLAGVAVNRNFDPVRGSIRNASVQGIFYASLRVEIRSPVAFQSATDQQLVKSVQPAQTAWFGNRHEHRMDRPADRRTPADFFGPQPRFPNPHPACWEHVEGKCSIVDADRGDTGTEPSLQRALNHGIPSGTTPNVRGLNDQIFNIANSGNDRAGSTS